MTLAKRKILIAGIGQKCRTLLYMFYCISLSLGRR